MTHTKEPSELPPDYMSMVHGGDGHGIESRIWAWSRDVRAALALHDDVADHPWEIGDPAPEFAGQGWEGARCARCGLRLLPLYLHVREINKPQGRGGTG